MLLCVCMCVYVCVFYMCVCVCMCVCFMCVYILCLFFVVGLLIFVGGAVVFLFLCCFVGVSGWVLLFCLFCSYYSLTFL